MTKPRVPKPEPEAVKKTRQPRGEPRPYQRASDGMWCVPVELPSRDGTRRRKVLVAKTEGAVKLKAKNARRDLLKNGDLSTSSVTVEKWMNIWFDTIALKKIAPRTASAYRGQINNYVIPAIGKIRLDKLTAVHIYRVADYITSKPKNPNDPSKGFLSSTTAMNTHRMLTVALDYAERESRITKNPAKLADAPRKAVANLGVMTALDGVKVLQAVAGDRLGSRWATALLTGARQGEVIGLELDRVTDVLDLSWQLQRITWEHGCGGTCGRKRGTDCPQQKITHPADWEYRRLGTTGLCLTRPKSAAGWRIIPLVEPLRTIIERRIAVAATEPNPHGLVWTQDPKLNRGGAKGTIRVRQPLDGSPLDPSPDNLAWHAVLERAGVASVPLHAARHTTASLLLEANVPEAIIMKILGHNSFAVTRAYQTVDRKQLDKALTAISALMPLDVPPKQG
ncbi:site-specific integrase [Cryobacterium sp. GrIS_2_6]|uniref:tyrosine-type recombinase/integrase n=1 Tax=Cryobacterium sp. GrIS_2_6 TaxID=3162785 RepID=UPI002E0155FE|nr:integrase [Cryobacterium psychrotolerans]MEC5149286.1 integrase [Cryobacterium psychrotolerans]MEC5149365.1 integrase [Cryobacterium psychrotolerans]